MKKKNYLFKQAWRLIRTTLTKRDWFRLCRTVGLTLLLFGSSGLFADSFFAVMELRTENSSYSGLVHYLSETLRAKFRKGNFFKVANYEQSRKLEATGLVEIANRSPLMVTLHPKLSVRKLLVAKLERVDGKFWLHTSLIDVNSNHVEYYSSFYLDTKHKLDETLNNFVQDVSLCSRHKTMCQQKGLTFEEEMNQINSSVTVKQAAPVVQHVSAAPVQVRRMTLGLSRPTSKASPVQRDSAFSYALQSLLLPGSGQFTSGRAAAALVSLGSTMAAAGAYYIAVQQNSQAQRNYESSRSLFAIANSNLLPFAGYSFLQQQSVYTQTNRNMQTAAAGLGAIWMMNIIDAYSNAEPSSGAGWTAVILPDSEGSSEGAGIHLSFTENF